MTVEDPWELGAVLYGRVDTDGIGLRDANILVGVENEKAIVRSTLVLAILDGSDVDSGTAAEIGFAAGLPRPVVGLRTDLRTTRDNTEALVNLQVEHFINRSGGTIVLSLDDALEALRRIIGELAR